MKQKLYIDIETFSSVDISTAGAYKYMESIDFEILMVAFAFNDEPIDCIDLAQGEQLPKRFIDALYDPNIEKHAHNANFERNAFKAYGYDVPVEQWYCSAVKSAYCGLPLSLEMVSQALKLEEKGKLSTGKALIKYFSVPIKPTKINGMRERNFPKHNIEKWEEFKLYCINDVEAEREIDKILSPYEIPEFERINYILDQNINDRGILIDLVMAENCNKLDEQHSAILSQRIRSLTNLENPNSPAQLKKWLTDAMGEEITTLAKEEMSNLIEKAESEVVKEVLTLRKKSSKSSTKKYVAMLNCACDDNRAHGLFQFYGANRTGRWAGRLVQLQNLPQNHLDKIEEVRQIVGYGNYEDVSLFYDDISSILSQLIRTAFIAPEGKTFAVADFSAIEARVIAWLADEKWRLDVFATHGKIYEASASMMFNVPIEQIKKGSELRDKGKISELALGYQGALGALRKMGGEKMGLSDDEMTRIVKLWRAKNKNIVSLWDAVDKAAQKCIALKSKVVLPNFKNLEFEFDGTVMTIKLPSGRKLFYQNAMLTKGSFGQTSVKYKGLDQVTKKWWWVDSYGGKFVENIVQAIARDLLAYSMQQLDKEGFPIVMHVHDETVAEVDKIGAEESLKKMENIMGQEVPWAKGLPLKADGYITDFYKKD